MPADLSASQAKRSVSLCSDCALPICRAERSRVPMPLLSKASTERDSGATCEAVGRLSPEPIQTAAPPPKALGRHGLVEEFCPPIPSCWSLRLLKCAPLPKGGQGPFFRKYRPIWGLFFTACSCLPALPSGDNPCGRACGLCGVRDNFSPCRLRLRLRQRTTAGEFSRSPRSPLGKDPGLSRIYLPESGPARATKD